jgi:hypothetical protein
MAFGIVKNCKTKDYEDSHAEMDWKKIKRNMTQYLLLHWLKLKACSESVN